MAAFLRLLEVVEMFTEIGLLILRATIGLQLAAHGSQKLFGGSAGVASKVTLA